MPPLNNQPKNGMASRTRPSMYFWSEHEYITSDSTKRPYYDDIKLRDIIVIIHCIGPVVVDALGPARFV